MAITVENLTVGYGRTTILNDLSFGPLEVGKLVGLIGPNAAGKSTLVKTLAGIKTPLSGKSVVTINGKAIEGKERLREIGYVPQDLLSTASLTAFESVVVSARHLQRTIDPVEETAATMETLGITHLADRFVSDMSGGQRQLVGVAQMMVRSPSVMLLDEPTSALDLHHQVHLLRLLRKQVTGTNRLGVVAIHDLNLAARFCDELLVIKDGRFVALDTPTNVLTPELLQRIYAVEARILDDAGTPVVCPV